MTEFRALLLALLLLFAGCSAVPQVDLDAPTTDRGDEWTVTVVRVIDGDTYEVEYRDGSTGTVRLLGVDTPEVHVETDPAEFEGVPNSTAGREWLRDWGHRASEFARAELRGGNVTIRTDPAADRRDRYGRLLVYVERDGADFNRRLVEQGYARLYDAAFARREAYARAEATARERGVGLWGYGASETVTTRTATAATAVPDGGQPPLAVVEVHADAAGNDHENLDDEYVVFENVGNGSLDLSGWRVRDATNHTYSFPAGFTLAPGERVTLYTASGTDAPADLHWGADGAVWNNAGDAVVVLDGRGERVLVHEYGDGAGPASP